MTRQVLFLCSGNYYRSRYAEILFNWLARERGLPWRADSRGLAISDGNPGPISHHTLARLAEREIACDSVDRFPCDVTLADLATADAIVAVKRTEHLAMIERRFPDWVDRVEFWEVHDLDAADPEQALPHLEREVAALLERIAPTIEVVNEPAAA